MALNVSCCWKWLLFFLLVYVNGRTSRPSFMVTFPAVIESGSDAKLCASLLKPNESLVMNIYLVNGNQSTLLLQEKAEEEFHRCFNFKAPLVEAESVQKMKVELQGESFKMTEERKVMFRSYHPLTFIQTDKPIYTPGQTVNFRVVSVDTNFVPFNQQYSTVMLEDSKGNRIGQWTNVSSKRWILQRSFELNPEARQGMYKLNAFIGERMISHDFEVKKYVLPKFEVTVTAPKTVCIDDKLMAVEVCGKYTYGQPVPDKSWVKVCRDIPRYSHRPDKHSPICVNETIEMKKTGCAIHTLHASAFSNSTYEDRLENSLHIEATVTEEGTEITMTKSETISLTYEIGKVTLSDLPKIYEHGSVIEGRVKLTKFSGAPLPNKVTYILEENSLPSKLLLNLTTDSDGLASFFLNTSSLSKSDIYLKASVYPGLHYQSHKTPYISMDRKTVQLFQPATPYTPTLSELIIENIEQPLKCDAELTVTIKYYFIGETAEDFKTDIVYMVLSRGVIVHHGYEKVEVKSSNGAASGTVSFKLSVGADLAPAVQILAYCVLPSENVVAHSTKFDTEKCFKNKISLHFSPAKAVPGEKNTLQISAQPGSLCGLSAVDQSVLILESGKRLDTDKIFNLLPVQSVSDYPYGVEDECLHMLFVSTDNTYESLKRLGLKMASSLAVACVWMTEMAEYFGYQRQLNYRHNSGAYSTFGHGKENTWLTAFVLRSFGKAQKYIFIDPEIVQSAKEWLISRRDSDGCFIQQGRLFNNRMKGGVNDNVTMTAYIIASLLELETPVTDPVVTKGLSCLRSVIEDVKNTYTTALLAYTFSLAGDTDTRQKLFKKLEDVAISEGSRLHWSQSASADDSDSLAVEISSYVLLAALTAETLTTADLGFANRIVSWLVKQQNAYGGFSSTQDTVVALQALSLYATKVFSSDGSSTVTVQSAGDTHHFDVNQDNKLLYQEKQLQNVPAKYSIEVKGSTCVSVQVAQVYNIPTPTETKTLSIDAKIEGDCKIYGQHFIFTFALKYDGLQERTNMVIADIKLLSGFTADTSMLGTTSGTYASHVERVDAKDDHVIVYLKEIPKNIPMNYQIQMKQVLPVKNLRPAVVKVYDYYQTSDQSETEYSFHCQ
ncbi:alpha-2-macroglobulin-P-like [Onychostoma macrolepis]|uniref:alpha-2-macroglobulin-P-like n=1 Tax=Onychostoma macrolepis TaxID=369639 RepID=UPI00272C2212|nr:alpha-2-macroglobulin-P-like [Onychostoma macrolepis]